MNQLSLQLTLILVTVQKCEKCAPIKVFQKYRKTPQQSGNQQIRWASGPAAENADLWIGDVGSGTPCLFFPKHCGLFLSGMTAFSWLYVACFHDVLSSVVGCEHQCL